MSDLILAAIIASTILILVLCCVIGVFVNRKHVKIVKENSELYHEILKLNSSYHFYTDFLEKYSYYESCSSKRKLDNLSLVDVLITKIDLYYGFFESLLLRVQKNRQDYEKYCINYGRLTSNTNETQISGLKIKLKTFIKIEDKLYKQSKLNPLINTSVHIKANYTSPQGRNSYNKEYTFSYVELINVFNDYVKMKNQQKEYSYHVKIERAKMSDSLRYDVMRRDGFKCQICGATSKEGAKLHVDHIVPVSKGGKTVFSNLRTLCDRCNMGKSNKIE